MPKRLIDVIAELNVELDAIVEFLRSQGEEVDKNLNAPITDEQYELLVEEFKFEYLYDSNKRVYAKIDDVLKRSDFDSFKDKCNCNICKITVPDLRRILNSYRSANPDLSYFLKLAKQLGFGLNQKPQTLQAGSVNQEKINKNENTFLDILKQYKEELNFVTNQQEQIRKERLVFLNEKVKEVSNSLKGIGVGGDILNEWLKKLVDSYTASLDVSGKLETVRVSHVKTE